MAFTISEIDFYQVLRSNPGDEGAKALVNCVESKVDSGFERKKDALDTKQDIADLRFEISQSKAEIIKWVFIFMVGQTCDHKCAEAATKFAGINFRMPDIPNPERAASNPCCCAVLAFSLPGKHKGRSDEVFLRTSLRAERSNPLRLKHIFSYHGLLRSARNDLIRGSLIQFHHNDHTKQCCQLARAALIIYGFQGSSKRMS